MKGKRRRRGRLGINRHYLSYIFQSAEERWKREIYRSSEHNMSLTPLSPKMQLLLIA